MLLQKIKVNKGDLFYVNPGTIHATGAGILFAEIQQNSDSTYRIYDWGRTTADGNPRPIHLDQAMECLSFHLRTNSVHRGGPLNHFPYPRWLMVDCDAFQIEKLCIEKEIIEQETENLFKVWQVVEGKGCLVAGDHSMDLEFGDVVLIPACVQKYQFQPQGHMTLLKTTPGKIETK